MVLLGRVTPAAAETERLVLAGMPENLADATDTVLVPWHIELVRASASPAADPAQARRDVEALAARTRAGAVAWLGPPSQSPTLWVYDASSGQLLSRPLPSAPPYDDPTAASVALSIKTLLRHSSVAPPAERVTPPPAPPVRQRPYTTGAQAALRLSRSGTAGWRHEPRLRFGITWWPGFLPAGHGVGLQVELGPGQTVKQGAFRGRLHDLAATLAVRRDITLPWADERFSAVPMVGVGLHASRLRGEQPPLRQPVRMSRLLPSVAAGVDVYARVSRIVRIGVALHGALLARTDDYQSMQRTLAGVPGLHVSAGIGLLVSL